MNYLLPPLELELELDDLEDPLLPDDLEELLPEDDRPTDPELLETEELPELPEDL